MTRSSDRAPERCPLALGTPGHASDRRWGHPAALELAWGQSCRRRDGPSDGRRRTRPCPGQTGSALAIDLSALAVVSAGICLGSHHLAAMSALVPAVMVARTVAWRLLPDTERGHSVGWEVVALVAFAAIGGFNDWNSVHHHRIYDYGVPVAFPELSSIPAWMLLYWGLILRSMATLAWWRTPHDQGPSDRVRLGRTTVRSAPLKVGLQLALVLVTRQCIYRLYDDPVWSWAPFAGALLLYALLFRPSRRELGLACALLIIGPAVEALYVQVGGLHRYHLGWLGGVPVWIALWWVLGMLVWRDLTGRALMAAAGGRWSGAA